MAIDNESNRVSSIKRRGGETPRKEINVTGAKSTDLPMGGGLDTTQQLCVGDRITTAERQY